MNAENREYLRKPMVRRSLSSGSVMHHPWSFIHLTRVSGSRLEQSEILCLGLQLVFCRIWILILSRTSRPLSLQHALRFSWQHSTRELVAVSTPTLNGLCSLLFLWSDSLERMHASRSNSWSRSRGLGKAVARLGTSGIMIP